MALPFTEYCKIKDKYCLIYLGSAKDYLVQLRLLKPSIEEQLKGIELNICCRDEYLYIFNDNKTFPYSQINSYKNYFAHTKEIKCDMNKHPILELMQESSLTIPEIVAVPHSRKSCKSCFIISEGILPTKSIASEIIKKRIASLGLSICYDYKEADVVVGIESEEVFEAAAAGKRTILVESGIGTELFRKMFPSCEVWRV